MPHSISTPRNEAVCERFTSLYDELVLIVLVAGMLFVIGVQRNALLKYRPAYKGSSGPTSGDNLTPSVHPPVDPSSIVLPPQVCDLGLSSRLYLSPLRLLLKSRYALLELSLPSSV